MTVIKENRAGAWEVILVGERGPAGPQGPQGEPGTGGGDGITTEDAVDAVAAALVAGNNIDVTYNDTANTITVDVEALTTADIAGLDTALTGKQPLDAELTAIAGLTLGADNIPYFTGAGAAAVAILSPFARTVIDDFSAGAMRTTMAAGPIRRTITASVATTYAPLLTDENMMTTLSNASAITVTLPSNATSAVPIGAEFDFLWLGVGQPTFAAGSGATVNGTPGLKLRAQYSACTAKKIATNDWVVIGDLSA